MNRFVILTIVVLIFSPSCLAQITQDSSAIWSWETRKHNFKKSLYLSIPVIAVGIMTLEYKGGFINDKIKEERNEHVTGFNYKIDDYLALAPGASVFLIDAFSKKSSSNLGNQLIILLKSELIMTAIVKPLKLVTHVERPGGTNYESFPSGHTAQAFLGATFLHKEFGQNSAWYTVAGYSVATTVAVFRVLNNKHYLTDVLVGAGIGMLSTNLAYLSHRYRWGNNKSRSFTVVPTFGNDKLGIFMACQF